ncbi:MAG TPA: hypothetical protein VF604_20925 [Pyrinomonadaceae bacterium]|jgi:hypothetical protein
MFKSLIALWLAALLATGAAAQPENPVSPSNFTDKILNGLKLDESTPEDAVKLLGKPAKDEFDDFSLGGKHGMFQVSIKRIIQTGDNEKAYRKLLYKKLGETDDVTLRFYEGKLVQVIFDYDSGQKEKRIPAYSLSAQFGVDFIILKQVAKGSTLADFEGQKENTVPKVYEVLYTLLSVQKDRIYFVRVENNDSKGFWRSLASKPTREMFPGFVLEMHLISRAPAQKAE